MKIKVRNTTIDSENEPIMLLFRNDAQKDEVIKHLSDMDPKEGERKYIQFPEKMSEKEVEDILRDESSDISFKDKYIRLAADFENYKKRVEKDKESLIFKIKSDSLNSILDLDSD